MNNFQLEFLDGQWWKRWLLDTEPGRVDRGPFDYYVIADTALRVGGRTEVLSVSHPAGAIRLAESLWRDFSSTADSRLLGNDGVADFHGAPDYFVVCSGLIPEGEPGLDVRHLGGGLVELSLLTGESAVVPLSEYRREVVAYLEALRGFYAAPYKDPGERGGWLVGFVWGCVDAILRTGEPPAGFQDWDFGWYA